MEDQGKRLLLAVVIAFGIMMAWSFLFPPDKESEDKKTDETAEPGTGQVPDAPAPDQPVPPGGDAPSTETADKLPRCVDDAPVVFDSFKRFRAIFSRCDAALVSWTLRGERFEDRHQGGQIDMVPTGRAGFAPELDYNLYPMQIGFEPVEGGNSLSLPANARWTIEKQSDTGIDFTLKTDDLQVWKRFTIVPDDYLIQLRVEVKKLVPGRSKQSMRITTFQYQNPKEDTEGGWVRMDRAWWSACYNDGDLDDNSPGFLAEKGPQIYRGKVRWAGGTHAYFLAAVSLKEDLEHSRCVLSAVTGAPAGTVRNDFILGPPVELEDTGSYARHFTAYYGPKYLSKLDEADEVAGHYTGFSESVDLGWFGFIARPLLWLLLWFQSFVINWGIAIVMLTIVVKLVTLYWTTKSMRSMRSMAKLKPKVEEIQKRHKGDRQKAQVEVMALYKTHGVNPLSGCLPMLLQMPIWIALYQTLRVSAELFQAPLIPGWIDDLTAPDPLYILPIGLMVVMFVQARLTPATADSTQQKIMQYGMPLMFGVMGFFFPAGLTLYIFTNTCLTALHHLWMRRTDPDHADDAKGGAKTGAKSAAAKTSGRAKAAASSDDAGDADDADDADDAGADDDSGKGAASKSASRPAKRKSAGKKRGGKKKKRSSR